jgi:hypothetical protein
MASYLNGVATVGTAPTLVVSVTAENDGVLIQNQGATPIYLGGSGVTADSSATGGLQVAANSTQLVPSAGGRSTRDLYAVVASGTAKVAWLMPAGD